MISNRRFTLLSILGILMCLHAHAQSPAMAPPLPSPESVALEKLGLMNTFPPVGDKIVNDGNRYKYPQARWAMQHVRELVPTHNIRRGTSAPSELPHADINLGNVSFEDDKGKKTTIDQWQKDTYTDALLVMHKGAIVYEHYMNEMRPTTPHLMFSMTKSFTGLLVAQLAYEGKIDLDAPITKYVPELAESAWGDMKVREAMDMTGTVRYREVFTDPTSEVFPYLYASNMLPQPQNYNGPKTIDDYLKMLKKGDGEHGAGFNYRTVHSEVLGWIVSRVTGENYADYLSERVWSKLGAEEDAYMIVDSVGTPLQGSGMNATARDLARFGEMVRRGGEFNGQRIFAQAVIDDLRKGGDREKFKTAPNREAWAGYSYHNQWWISHDADGAFEALGVNGQYVRIDPAAEMVVVKFSSHPSAYAGVWHASHLKAFAAMAKAIRGESSETRGN